MSIDRTLVFAIVSGSAGSTAVMGAMTGDVKIAASSTSVAIIAGLASIRFAIAEVAERISQPKEPKSSLRGTSEQTPEIG